MRAIVRYVKERIKWELAGKPMRSEERIREIFHQICKPCPHFGGDHCKVCGCYLREDLTKPKFNKIAWATTHCPDDPPKWIEELEADVDEEKAQEMAEKEVEEMEKPPQIVVRQRPAQKQSGCCGTP